MNEKLFWECIEHLDWDQQEDEEIVEPVISKLTQMEIEDIFAFDEILSEKLYKLDTMAHAKEIGEDAYINDDEYFSVDNFLYSRCVVVANGEEIYDEALADPREMPEDMEFEALLYIASEAYERKTGETYEHVTQYSPETFANEEAWA